MSKRILKSDEITELLGRLKKGESYELIGTQMNIALSTIANFKSYFINQGHDFPASFENTERGASTTNTTESRPKKLATKRVATNKRQYTRYFQPSNDARLNDKEVYIKINEVFHVLEKKPKVMIVGPTTLYLEF